MLASLRGARLLDGWRGEPAVDRPALVDMLLRVGRLADEAPEISELDLNPVVAWAPGAGAQALDARVFVREPERAAAGRAVDARRGARPESRAVAAGSRIVQRQDTRLWIWLSRFES